VIGDVDQLIPLDLGVTLTDPGVKTLAVQFRMPSQSSVDRVDNEVQKIGFVGSVAITAGEDDAVRGAHVQRFYASLA
jgi:hypothetical protein